MVLQLSPAGGSYWTPVAPLDEVSEALAHHSHGSFLAGGQEYSLYFLGPSLPNTPSPRAHFLLFLEQSQEAETWVGAG